jgi:O-antigen/teichoic acid export membrane protein
MNREFLINIIFLVFINLLIKPLYIFGIDRTVQNVVGEHQYGIYYALFSFAFLFQSINDLGIQNFNTRIIAQDEHLLDKYFSNILTLKTLLAALYFVVLLVSAIIVGYKSAWFPMLISLGINNVLLALLIYLRSNVGSIGLYRLNSFLTVLDRLLLIVICSILLWVEPFKSSFSILWFIQAQNLTLFITVLVAFFFTLKRVKRFKITFNPPFLVHILRGSLPYALVFFLMTLYTRLDAVMLERLLPDGEKQAGIYASAYRLLDAVNVLGFFFATLLMPMFSKLLKGNLSVAPLVRLSFQLIWVGAVTIAVNVFFFRTEIMALLYKEATSFSGDVLGVLMFSFIAMSGIYVYSTLLGANGNTRQMNYIFLITIALNIILNIILIPSQRALGTAISTGITQFFVLFSLMFLTKKHLQLRGDTSWIARLILFSLSTFLISFLIKNYIFQEKWLLQIALSTGLCLVVSLLMGFFNYKKMGDLLNNWKDMP